MIKPNTFENIKDLELKNFISSLNNLSNGRIIADNGKKILPDENDDLNLRLKNEIVNFYNKKIFNNDVKKSLENNHDYPYYRQLDISKNMLFYKDIDYYFFLQSVVWMENNKYELIKSTFKIPESFDLTKIDFSKFNLDTLYVNYLYFLDSVNKVNSEKCYRTYDIDKYFKERFINFITSLKNQYILFQRKSDYLSLNQEANLLYNFLSPIGDKSDYQRYYNINKDMYDEETIRKNYRKMKTGKVGELIINDEKSFGKRNQIFVARDYGDGYGYDFYNIFNVEELKEVKSTLHGIKDDYFELSENEYNVFIDAFRNGCKYVLSRVFLTFNMDYKYDNYIYNYSIVNLTPKSETLLVSEDGRFVYECDDTSKSKKMFLKK